MEIVDGSLSEVVVQPLVLFSILGHYERKNPGEELNVIGALLGQSTSEGLLVTNCFPVPHEIKQNLNDNTEEVAVGKETLRQLQQLYYRANPNEEIIGWYSADAKSYDDVENKFVINEHMLMIHDFFSGEAADPLFLHINADFKAKSMEDVEKIKVKGFVNEILSLESVDDRPLAACFKEVSVQIQTSTTDKIVYDVMKQGKIVDRYDSTNDAIHNFEIVLEEIRQYLNEDKEKQDPVILEKISKAFESIPKIDPAMFAKSFNQSLYDLMMLTYLTNLTRTQLALSEKLSN